MNTRLVSTLLLVGVITHAPTPVGAEPQTAAQVDASFATQEAGRLLELARQHRFGALDAALEGLPGTPGMSGPTREAVLYRFAIGVRGLPVEEVPEQALRRLEQHAPIEVAHPESRGAYRVPLYDVAGAARGSLEMLDLRRASESLARGLRGSPKSSWDTFVAAGKAGIDPRVLVSALERLDPAELRLQRQAAAGAFMRDPALAPAVAVVALGTGDESLAGTLIEAADPATALRVITRIPDRFAPSAALRLLASGTVRGALASAAVSGIGVLARAEPAARDWLLDHVDDTGVGESAAVALSRLGDPGIVRWAADGLQPDVPRAGLRHRLLLLQLDGGELARGALERFAADTAMPASLRAKVRAWL